MKAGLIEKIEGYGHWRVNFRPAKPLSVELSFQQCSEAVHNNVISIRGWDYPHVSRREDDQGGSSRFDSYYEEWCDWNGFYEFWRMYKSGQFLSYNTLTDDSRGSGDFRVLNIRGAIYSISEFIEFGFRLHKAGIYKDGFEVVIELRNTEGRVLDVGPSRIPFFEQKRTGAEKIILRRNLSAQSLEDNHRAVAINILMELFDYFGWNPQQSQIAADQAKFYRRDFY